jgi:hypothetical protein
MQKFSDSESRIPVGALQDLTNDAAQLGCAAPSLTVAFFTTPSISDRLSYTFSALADPQ